MPAIHSFLLRRTAEQSPNQNYVPLVVGLAVTAGCLVIIPICVYHILRHLRPTHPNPKYIPTTYLKTKWRKWNPPGAKTHKSQRLTTSHLEPISEAPSSRNSRIASSYDGVETLAGSDVATTLTPNNNTADNRNSTPAMAGAGIDRNTSIRSIMTLPAYAPTPTESEQVLGRAGERDGIDTVVQFPDIAEAAEEERREDEMEALYQIRLARRQEIAAREERRRLRREARERGDTVALEELRRSEREDREARRRVREDGEAAVTDVERARLEHERVRERPRAVSTVSYKDLGVARHDGTRIRANSEESERPLLGDAESMAASRRRGASISSVQSFDSMSDLHSLGLGHSRAASMGESDAGNMGAGGLQIHVQPPEYETVSLNGEPEGPPDYSSPIELERRNISGNGDIRADGIPRLPSLRLAGLPSIRLEEPTPVSGPGSAGGLESGERGRRL